MSKPSQTLSFDPVTAAIRFVAWLRRRFVPWLIDDLKGFGVLDFSYMAILYAVGSYIVFDTPLNLAVLLIYLAMVHSRWKGWHRWVMFVALVSMVVLTISGIWIMTTDRVTSLNSRMRVFHQLFSRYAFLAILPYFVFHVRQSFARYHGPGFRLVTRIGWLLLKASLWIGAFVALLTIRGLIIPYHVWALLFSIPFVMAHIFLARRIRRQRIEAGFVTEPVRPFEAAPMIGWPSVLLAIIVGVIGIGVVVQYPDAPQWVYANDPTYMQAGKATDLTPSRARLPQGDFIQAPLLAQSNSCSADECHPVMYRAWEDSPHRVSVDGPYLDAARSVIETEGVAAARLCAGCHDPISLYSGTVTHGQEIPVMEGIREGISCIACHATYSDATTTNGNGSLSFVYPEAYHLGPKRLVHAVGVWREHERDFNTNKSDSGQCVACHKIEPLEDARYASLNTEWLLSDVHAQPKMLPVCRAEDGCIACHMKRRAIPEKPRLTMMRDHAFGVVTTPEELDD